jgi:hypothetical protein
VIAASGILVVIAFVTLIIGVFNTGLSLIWASIAASVLAAIFLALGVVQTNKRRIAPAGGAASSAATSPWSEGTGTAVMERESAPAAGVVVEEARPSLQAVPRPSDEELFAPSEEPAKAPAAKTPTAKAPAAKAPAAKAPARRAAAAPAATVVVVPDRDKYHKETCRYAKNPAAMTMTKAAARRQGYTACGTCKP